jgi:hypothetical protein
MVLQDTGGLTPDSFSDDPYANDQDPYSTSHPPTSVSGVSSYDASALPQPIPIIGPFLGFSRSAVRWKTDQTIKFAEKSIHRSMTPEEAHALASHLYHGEQLKSYTTAAGASFGAWRWYNTMDICKYPLYKPKPEEINRNKFLFVQGPIAQQVRQSWRFMVWVFVAGELGKLVGSLIAQPKMAQGAATDPRLAQFSSDLKAAREGPAARRRESFSRRAEQNPDAIPGQQLPPHAGAPRPWPRRSPALAPPPAAADDMSPTAGNEAWSSDGYDAQSDFVPDHVDGQQRRAPVRNAQSSGSSGRRTERPMEDDASPTGGLFEEETEDQSKPGESAWERLRRGGGPASGQRQPLPPRREEHYRREPRQESNLGDSFTFSDTDEERRRAQEKAQREFDERLERERQGKDFSDNKRW